MTAAPTLPGVTLTDADRRFMLRQLAKHHDEYEPCRLSVLVRKWAPHLTDDDRRHTWAGLCQTVALLDDLHAGAVEWRQILPHAVPARGHELAGEHLEAEIDGLLDVLGGEVDV